MKNSAILVWIYWAQTCFALSGAKSDLQPTINVGIGELSMSANRGREAVDDVNEDVPVGNESPRSNAIHCDKLDSLFLLLKSCTKIAPVAPKICILLQSYFLIRTYGSRRWKIPDC